MPWWDTTLCRARDAVHGGVPTLACAAAVLVGLLLVNRLLDAFAHSQTKESHIGVALLRQAHEWLATSQQDGTPMVALQHANFAMAYLNASRHVASDLVLEQHAHLDVHKLSRKIDARQKSALAALQKACPKLSRKQFQTPSSAWIDR